MILSCVLWEQFVVNKIYYCVWGISYIDFFFPDHWYHGSSGGDMIKPGWSVSKLKNLWYYIIAVSIFVSAALASSRPSFSKRG